MTKKYKYRFKTLEEFMSDYGDNWRSLSMFNSYGEMDYLLGMDVNVPRRKIDDNGDVIYTFGLNGWAIVPNMLKKIIVRPEYKPKRLVYE
jgi:hypothetical protein